MKSPTIEIKSTPLKSSRELAKMLKSLPRDEHFSQLSGALQRSTFNFCRLGLHDVHLLQINYDSILPNKVNIVKWNFSKNLTTLTLRDTIQFIEEVE